MKKIFSMMLSVSLILILVGCGGGGAKEEPKVKYEGEVVEYKLGDYGTIQIPKEYNVTEGPDGVMIRNIPDADYQLDILIFPLDRITPYKTFKLYVDGLKDSVVGPADEKLKIAGKDGIGKDQEAFYTLQAPINKEEDVLVVNITPKVFGEKTYVDKHKEDNVQFMLQSIKFK